MMIGKSLEKMWTLTMNEIMTIDNDKCLYTMLNCLNCAKYTWKQIDFDSISDKKIKLSDLVISSINSHISWSSSQNRSLDPPIDYWPFLPVQSFSNFPSTYTVGGQFVLSKNSSPPFQFLLNRPGIAHVY